MEHFSAHLCGSQLPLSSIIGLERRIVLVIASRKSIDIITAAVNQSNLSLVIVEKNTMVDAENFLKLNCDAIAFVVSVCGAVDYWQIVLNIPHSSIYNLYILMFHKLTLFDRNSKNNVQ